MTVARVGECWGKRRYLTWRHAASDAKRLRRRVGHPVEPYHCRACGGVHVGHTMKVPA